MMRNIQLYYSIHNRNPILTLHKIQNCSFNIQKSFQHSSRLHPAQSSSSHNTNHASDSSSSSTFQKKNQPTFASADVAHAKDDADGNSTLPEQQQTAAALTWCWQGSDEFTPLDDRKNLPPLPLPSTHLQNNPNLRIVLVRHGQSTWNARNRIQGSSDFSVLTEEGVWQAHSASQLLQDWTFDVMFASPLKRAAKTSHIVWGPRQGTVIVLPSLREVDLYSFQGLDKATGRSQQPKAYDTWQRYPHQFEIDGHWPVRELWYRASVAWQRILTEPALCSSGLVVAHNAVNQALICTALGLDPVHFRRLTQTNAAFTVLDFEYVKETGGIQARVQRMNHFPDAPLKKEKLGKGAADRLLLVSGSAKSPKVARALSLLSESGADVAPLVTVGSPDTQAADVATALQATLSTPRPAHGRLVSAVVAPEACQRLIDVCLGTNVSPKQRVGHLFDGRRRNYYRELS